MSVTMKKKNEHAMLLGAMGGHARAKLSPEVLSQIGKKAVQAREAKRAQKKLSTGTNLTENLAV